MEKPEEGMSGRGEFVGHFVAGEQDGRPTASFGDDWRLDLLKKEEVGEILTAAARKSNKWAETFARQALEHGFVALHVYVTPGGKGGQLFDFLDCACKTWTRGGGGSNVQ